VIGRAFGAIAAVVTLAVAGPLLDGLARRILAAPRRLPDEAALRPALEALGGEIVRLRSRDGLRLAGRWLLAEPEPGADWRPDPHEAIVLLHGYSGSVAPDVVEYAPFLRRIASVFALDFRGHGESDDAPTTFGMHEVEDVAGVLAWLADRGINRAALFGTSMGGMTAIASVAVLGDGRLAAADTDPDAPAITAPPPRPQIVGVVADSVAPELRIVVGNRMPLPFGRFFADRGFDRATRLLQGDPRHTEPIRMIGLLEDVPLLLLHGEADETVPLADGRRLADAAPRGSRHLVLAGAEHTRGHALDPAGYEAAVGAFLRDSFLAARPDPIAAGGTPILATDTSTPVEPSAGQPETAG
jgi:uncharacterized protein